MLNGLGTYGFQILNTNAQAAVPELIQIAKENISTSSQVMAIVALGDIGPKARQAVPYLLQWSTNKTSEVRTFARLALVDIDPEAAAKAGITNGP